MVTIVLVMAYSREHGTGLGVQGAEGAGEGRS